MAGVTTTSRLFSAALALALLTAACAGGQGSGSSQPSASGGGPSAGNGPTSATPPSSSSPGPPGAATVQALAPSPAASPAAQSAPLPKIGGSVTVLGTWGGSEQASFMAMVQPFQEQTGVQVQYEGTRDLNAVLTTRVQGGNPPDLAGLPGPGQMAELARAGKLIDLATVLDQTAMRAQYAEDWLKLGTVDGKQVGIFIKAALKGTIWYNVHEFSKVSSSPPRTWGELMSLSEQIANSGTAPWCIGLESGAASGWPGTDWIENIMLRSAGPDKYDQWWQGSLSWSSPEVSNAWRTWGRIVGNDKMVYGGRQFMLATNFGDAGNPLFTSPPRCYMHMQGSFITDFFVKANPNLKPVQDFNFFPFPTTGEQGTGQNLPSSQEVAGDLFGMFKDTPQARALMKYLTTPEAQSIWVKRGGAISPNKTVPLQTYPDDLSRQMAQTLTSAATVRFDASDLMPEAMNNAFLRAVLDYVQNPNNLDSILAGLDKTQKDSYAATKR